MVFSSTIFLLAFLPAVLVLYYNPITKGRRYRNTVLILFSLFFYAWGEPVFVFLMLFMIFMAWILGLALEKGKYRKELLIAGISLFILILFIFKYYTFTATELVLFFKLDAKVAKIVLPIGISFFTFQLMSYLFDVYRGTAKPQKNFFDVALYIALFPQLIAGPIVRYETVADEIKNRVETREDITEGFERFVFGLAKKVLLANFVAQIADSIFETGADLSVGTAWLGAVSYTLQIYYDFSGYSDMAIGLGRMFGFHFSENFNYPYISGSITEFWRRWHISLSSFFRDYVYIPLGGNRVSKLKWVRNLFVVWLLTGIWHGANWTFILWGLFYFVLLLVEKLTNIHKKVKGLSYLYTAVCVILAWVIFRSESVSAAFAYIGKMFGSSHAGFIDDMCLKYLDGGKAILLPALLFVFPIWPQIRNVLSKSVVGETIESIFMLTAFGLSFLVTVSSTYNPFIYFNF